MTTVASQDQIGAARAYEALFVPALFGDWASRVADLAKVQPGQKVLDVACGTGILAREALSRAGPNGYVAGLDPNPGMLAVAHELAPAIDCRQGIAESIPFPESSFDAVVSQFGLMFFSDRQRALQEMLRVLTADGRLAIAVWDALANMRAFADEVALLQRLAGERAADALRAPFVLGDRDTLLALFRDAGAASIEITTHRGTARFPSVRVMVEADLRGWLTVMGVNLSEEHIARVLEGAEDALGEYAGPGGQVIFETRAHLIGAKKS